MKPRILGATLAVAFATTALSVAGCAGPTQVRNVLPGLGAADLDASAGYEAIPSRTAAEVLPPDLLKGPHYRVHEAVGSDGFLNLYTVESDFGVFEVAGDDLLRVRIHEIGALAELDQMQKRDEFAKAVTKGLKSPFVAAWNLIRDPVDSIRGVPEAAWEAVKKTAEISKRERGELEDSGFREVIGFEAKKRALAFQLGVDPYSSNRELQKQMNRFAWAAYLGGLPFALVPFQGSPTGEEIGPASESADERLREILRSYAPEDLRRLNRIELAVMGVGPELADGFLTHLWYSPRHGTILIESLVALDLAEDRATFIETAMGAGSEADARFYQRAAQLLRAYHETRDPLSRVAAHRNAVMGLTLDGELVVPLILDHTVWSRPAADFADRLREAKQELGADVIRLLVSGTLSERARAEFDERDIDVTERAFERLNPPVAKATP
ncbi:MAG: hypothetical protein JRH10_11600 [Deltaproteobacteria bacterium]|nr:hypothetical protein [Deltaproteobacteria bacterium]MBW2447935.1 hypothetical protein [Deltaproteobacteria bacterium]